MVTSDQIVCPSQISRQSAKADGAEVEQLSANRIGAEYLTALRGGWTERRNVSADRLGAELRDLSAIGSGAEYSDQHFCYHQWCPTTIAEGGKLMRANGKTMLVKAAAFHTLPLLCATTRRRVALPLDVKGLQPHQVAIATQLPRALPTRHPTITYHHPILISSTSRRPTTTEKTWRVWGKKRNDRQEDEVWVMLYFF
ncbi:hypothetical protein OsJ_25094 [Oryza sativa Japonica Group]|uniref:Uncharacterized protein n=1 Tax=Oryza sativa subsp. japonica TaxID=39947 RepID=B9FU66_ORYSJ|nr:hypothetical protein OsJ_25094 [Oryza sativa Japonica Group]